MARFEKSTNSPVVTGFMTTIGGLETIQGAGPPTSDSVSQGGTPDTDVIISKIRFYTSELHGLLDVLENKPD